MNFGEIFNMIIKSSKRKLKILSTYTRILLVYEKVKSSENYTSGYLKFSLIQAMKNISKNFKKFLQFFLKKNQNNNKKIDTYRNKSVHFSRGVRSGIRFKSKQNHRTLHFIKT